MRVVVPALEPGSAAHLALAAEGVEHTEHVCKGDIGYSNLLVDLWREGEGFVTVEHDIAPWMGAVTQLIECERDWCMFHYPKDGGGMTRGLGCAKFSARLTREHPGLWEQWQGTDWRILDGSIGAAVADALKSEQPEQHPLCYHDPPVAHVRRS